jgi:hypothetical protein
MKTYIPTMDKRTRKILEECVTAGLKATEEDNDIETAKKMFRQIHMVLDALIVYQETYGIDAEETND